MKMKTLISLIVLVVSINIYGQSKIQPFRYEKTEGGSTLIYPNNEVNRALAKGKAILSFPSGYIPSWHDDCRVKPFQELIDAGIFSKERMKELEKEDQTHIDVTFDETGIVSYVYFYIGVGEKMLLTEKELYEICRKYKGVWYDLTKGTVYKSETGSKTVFYSGDFFTIPFKDLKY